MYGVEAILKQRQKMESIYSAWEMPRGIPTRKPKHK